MFAMLSGGWPRRTPDGTPVDDLEDEARAAAIEDLVADLVAAQEAAGIGLVRDGDVRWADPEATVLAAIARGDAGDAGPLVRAWRATSARTDLPVAQAVPGPWTLALRDVGGWGHAEVVAGRAAELADALADDVAALVAAGCPVVQVVEPAAVTVGESAPLRAGFLRAHRRLLARAPEAHAMLAITGGSAHLAGPDALFGAPYRSYLFDLIAGPDNWYPVRAAPGDRGIVCAALVAGQRRAAADQAPVLSWAAHYAASSNGRGLERVGLANATPLGSLDRESAQRALDDLGRAATLAALPPKEAVDVGMDPRSIVVKQARPRR
jgi:hypothetical protein